METQTINFAVCKQSLIGGEPLNLASGTVNYINAVFDLSTEWTEFESVRAVWANAFHEISTVLDSNGACVVPSEVLARKGTVRVNLVGSNTENGELIDRLTTEPIVALIVAVKAKLNGENTQPVTPSEFEQFVDRVETAAEKAEGAEEYAQRAETAAEYAEEAAGAAIKVKNMTVSAETLPAGSQATVEKTETETAFNLEFGIPQGERGERGDKGIQGETGNGIANAVLNADYTLTITFTDGTSYTTPPIRGEQGVRGIQGETGDPGATGNGIASAVLNSDYTLTLTFTDGTSYTTPSIRGAQGVQGDDYVLTAQDKSDIADIVIAEIGSADTMSF